MDSCIECLIPKTEMGLILHSNMEYSRSRQTRGGLAISRPKTYVYPPVSRPMAS